MTCSTELSNAVQLMKVFEEWTDILDSGGERDVIYMDFMKAFDSVPHKLLLGITQLEQNRRYHSTMDKSLPNR